jgi:NAD(P)-dependent dehydrogenase (short-subunit alcohol dehydrogenase family)
MKEPHVDGRLSGKVAIITGAGTGQGAAAARAFVAAGARVALLDIDPASASDVAASLPDGSTAVFECDVSDAGTVERTIGEAVARFGALHIIYNNAGILKRDAEEWRPGQDGGVVDLEEDAYAHTMAVNVNSVFYTTKFGIPHLIDSGGGSIVNTASISGALIGSANHAYAASKGAVVGLTRSIALTYGPSGVRCNAICPGLIPTRLAASSMRNEASVAVYRNAPLRRLGEVEEIAALALFLASDESSFITGAIIAADGGFTLS